MSDQRTWQQLLNSSPALAGLFSRQPAYRFWTDGRGWSYCYTTENMGDGKYAAFVYRPFGKGSRSGKATQLKKVREVRFKTRRAAKARASKWYEAALAAERQKRGAA
jgi:hypothetical protein